jgi:RNA polymerase sigma factor (sigma-70 family)
MGLLRGFASRSREREATEVAVAAQPVTPVTPRDLARLAANGDAAATTKLLQHLAPSVQRVVRGVMGSQSADLDDVMQQSLIALIHALPAFRGECEPAGYACRIALRTALAVRKRNHGQRAMRDSSTDAELVPAVPCANEDIASRQRTELLRALLDEIPEEQAEALTMRSVLGWSLDEIASASGAPVNTVRSRLRLAKEALREKIEADPALAEGLGVAQ